MKRLLKFSALLCAFAMTISVGFTTAFAGTKSERLLEDLFSNSIYDGSVNEANWTPTFTTSTKTIKQQDVVTNPSLQFVKGNSGGEWVQYGTRNKVENIKSVSYSFMIPDGAKRGTWFSVSFIGQLDPSHAGYYLYDAPLMLNDNIGGLGNVNGKWVSVKIVPTSDLTADVYYALRNDDGTVNFPASPSTTISGFKFSDIQNDNDLTDEQKAQLVQERIEEQKWSFKNAFVMWGCEGQGEGICLDDVKIVAEDGEDEGIEDDVYQNNFDVLNFEDPSFRAFTAMGRAESAALKVAEDNRMLFEATKAGDRIISKAIIEKDESVADFITCLDVSFTMQISSDEQDAFAFAFGLESDVADPTQNGCSYIVEVNEDGDAYGRFVEYKDGAKVKEQTPTYLEKVTGKRGAELSFTVAKDGSVVVKQNGATVSDDFVVSNYAGHFGFYSPKNNVETVRLDNVTVDTTTYYVPTTKSVTHNFENDFFGNKGFEDFYLTSEGGKMSVNDGKLVWDACSDFSYFGSAHEYDGFILDYQVCSIFVTDDPNDISATKPGVWMGLDLSRSRKTTHRYGSYATVIFQMNPTGDEVFPAVYIDQEVSDLEYNDVLQTVYRPIPASLLTDIHYDGKTKTETQIRPEDALCVRWVADANSNSLKLYLKKLSEADFTLYYEVFLNTTGYAMLTCTGYLSCKIDNFSMSNVSPIYNVANNEVPETIYPDPIIKPIYTKPDVDVNLDEELKVNMGGKLSWLWLVGGLVVGLAGLGAGFLVAFKAKKATPTVPSSEKESGSDL